MIYWFLSGFGVVLVCIVVSTLAVASLKCLRPLFRRDWRTARKEFAHWLPIAGAVLALGLTYETLRIQAQQSSENALNDAGNAFVAAEYENPNFRCLYRWHAYNNPGACLSSIISSSDSF